MSTLPDTEDSAPPASRSDLRWLVLFASSMLLAGVACWLAYPLAASAYRSWRTHQHLSLAQEKMNQRKWVEAAGALREARTLTPNDPDVLHASLSFLQLMGRDARGAVQLVQQLQKDGHATPADLIVMGKMRMLLGETAEARQIYDSLAETDRQGDAAQELHADLLQNLGEQHRANAIRRALFQKNTTDPQSLRKQAALEMREGTAAERKAMRARLWTLARAPGPLRVTAVDLLSQDRQLTTPEAAELRQIADSLPADSSRSGEDLETLHLRVLSAQIRTSPQSRQERMDQEIQRWKDRPPAQVRPLIAWLSAEGEHARILRLVPPALAAKFTDLLPFYIEALRKTRAWAQLDGFLSSGGIDPAFSKTEKGLWQAEARAALDEDPGRARQMLSRLMEDAGRGADLSLTLKCADLAERQGWWDLARQCFSACAARHPFIRTTMLVRAYEMAEHQHDGPAMLQACEQLVQARPEDPSLREQRLYLQALLGIDLETAGRQLEGLAGKGVPARADQRHLIAALLAYRQGRTEGVRAALPKVRNPSALTAGERAVYCGLLKVSGGDAAAAFRIVEKISPALLLPEEKKFALRAL